MSDLHLDGGAQATGRATRVVGHLHGLRERLDAVATTGDIAEHGLPAEYEEARALLDGIAPTMLCPGNHDARPAFRRLLLDEDGGGGPVNRLYPAGRWRIAMCDSSIPGRDDGRLTDETLAWLADVLAATPCDARVLVAYHHPPVPLHSPSVDAIRLKGAERLAELVGADERVAAVLCGHAHTAAAATFAGCPLLVAPGVASSLRLPWEGAEGLDSRKPPAIAFHVLGDDGAITTHYRVIPNP